MKMWSSGTKRRKQIECEWLAVPLRKIATEIEIFFLKSIIKISL
jgi:hypothetical protein